MSLVKPNENISTYTQFGAITPSFTLPESLMSVAPKIRPVEEVMSIAPTQSLLAQPKMDRFKETMGIFKEHPELLKRAPEGGANRSEFRAKQINLAQKIAEYNTKVKLELAKPSIYQDLNERKKLLNEREKLLMIASKSLPGTDFDKDIAYPSNQAKYMIRGIKPKTSLGDVLDVMRIRQQEKLNRINAENKRIEGFEKRVNKLSEWEKNAGKRAKKIEDLVGLIPGFGSKISKEKEGTFGAMITPEYWSAIGRKTLSLPAQVVAGLPERVALTAGKLAAAAEGLTIKRARGNVLGEFGRAAKETPIEVARSFDPRKPEGLINIIATAAMIKYIQGKTAASWKYQPKPGTQVKNLGGGTVSKGNNVVTTSEALFKNRFGQSIRVTQQTAIPKFGGKGTFTQVFRDATTGKLLTRQAGIAKYSVGIEQLSKTPGSELYNVKTNLVLKPTKGLAQTTKYSFKKGGAELSPKYDMFGKTAPETVKVFGRQIRLPGKILTKTKFDVMKSRTGLPKTYTREGLVQVTKVGPQPQLQLKGNVPDYFGRLGSEFTRRFVTQKIMPALKNIKLEGITRIPEGQITKSYIQGGRQWTVRQGTMTAKGKPPLNYKITTNLPKGGGVGKYRIELFDAKTGTRVGVQTGRATASPVISSSLAKIKYPPKGGKFIETQKYVETVPGKLGLKKTLTGSELSIKQQIGPQRILTRRTLIKPTNYNPKYLRSLFDKIKVETPSFTKVSKVSQFMSKQETPGRYSLRMSKSGRISTRSLPPNYKGTAGGAKGELVYTVKPDGSATINLMGAHPENIGTGTKLMNAFLRQHKGKINVLGTEPATPFYKQFGFEGPKTGGTLIRPAKEFSFKGGMGRTFGKMLKSKAAIASPSTRFSGPGGLTTIKPTIEIPGIFTGSPVSFASPSLKIFSSSTPYFGILSPSIGVSGGTPTGLYRPKKQTITSVKPIFESSSGEEPAIEEEPKVDANVLPKVIPEQIDKTIGEGGSTAKTTGGGETPPPGPVPPPPSDYFAPEPTASIKGKVGFGLMWPFRGRGGALSTNVKSGVQSWIVTNPIRDFPGEFFSKRTTQSVANALGKPSLGTDVLMNNKIDNIISGRSNILRGAGLNEKKVKEMLS